MKNVNTSCLLFSGSGSGWGVHGWHQAERKESSRKTEMLGERNWPRSERAHYGGEANKKFTGCCVNTFMWQTWFFICVQSFCIVPLSMAFPVVTDDQNNDNCSEWLLLKLLNGISLFDVRKISMKCAPFAGLPNFPCLFQFMVKSVWNIYFYIGFEQSTGWRSEDSCPYRAGLHNIQAACGPRKLSHLQKMLQKPDFG